MRNDAESFVDVKLAVNPTSTLAIDTNENVSSLSNVTYAEGKSPHDVIKTFMAYLDTTTSYGTTALDGAIKACSNFTGIQDAINHMISDCQNANSYTEFLTEKCGIILSNADTGAITGSDAGGSTVKDEYSIVPESGSRINFTGSSFTVDGLTLNLGLYDTNYNFTPTTYDNLTSAQKFIWQSAYTWWVKGALALNAESYGKNFGFDSYSSATTKTINFGFQTLNNNTLAWTLLSYDSYGKNTALGMGINMTYYNAIDQSDPNGSSSTYGATYLDRTLAHEFTHAIMSTNIDYFNKLPKFIREGMAELTHGIDDERGSLIITLAQNPSSLSSALNLNLTSGGDSNTYAGGYMFLRYLAKQGAVVESLGKNIHNSTSNTLITGTAYSDEIYNTGSNVTISVGAGDDSINNDNAGNYASILAGDGNDTVVNNSNAYHTTIYAGGGDDKISVSYSGTDLKIDGGDGADTITGYFHSSSINGGDGNDLISISGGTSNTVSTGYGNDTITGRFGSSSINGGSGNDLVSIGGGAGNTVSGGYGNDTVISSITSGVKYLYTSGYDLIRGWTNYDTLSLTGGLTFSGQSTVGSNVLLTVSNGYTITLEGAAGKTLNIYPELNQGKYIYNTTSSTLITGTAHEDTIYNTGSNVTISVGAGADSIYHNGTYSSINGGDGADTITGSFYSSSINGGDGNDSIIASYASNSSINGGYGNDFISIGGGYSGNKVYMGYGNDTVYSSVSYGMEYFYSGGRDYLSGVKWSDTVRMAEGTVKGATLKSGTNLIISLASGSDELTLAGAAESGVQIVGLVQNEGNNIYNYNSNAFVTGTGVNDTVYNTGSKVTISVGAGADSINNAGYYASILADIGNDIILNNSYYATVLAGGGDDTVSVGSSGDYSRVEGNSGNDSIYSYDGDYMTIDGGDGADTITGYFYSSSISGGYGNDLISIDGGSGNTVSAGYGNDTVISSITSGVKYLYTSGNDLIRGWANYDTLSLTGGLTFSEQSTVGSNVLLNVSNGYTITLEGAAGKVLNIYPELTQGKYIYNVVSNTLITGTSYNDSVLNYGSNVTISVGAGNDSVHNHNSPSYILTDAGDDTIFNDTSYTTIYAGADADSIKTSAAYTSVFAGNGDDTVSVGYGGDYSRVEGNSGNDSIYSYDGDYMTIDGGDGADTITGYFYSSSISGGYGNDLISIDGGWDNTVSAGYGNDTVISSITSGVKYLYTSGYDLIRDWGNYDTLSLTGGLKFNEQSTVGSNVLLSVSNGYTITLEGAAGKTLNIYPEMDTGAKNIYNTTSNTILTGTAQDDTIRNTGKQVTISVGDGADSISNTGTYASILAGDGIDTIMSSGRYSTIYAGIGSDIVSIGNAGDYSFIDLGTGNDSAFISDGDYVSVNGGYGSDTIAGKFWSSSISGGADNDLISIGGGGANNTVNTGYGNDTVISALASGIVYNFTGGNDLIQGWTNRDSINVTNYWERVTIGNDVLVSVEGVGVTTLVGAKGKTINVYPKDLCVEIDTSGVNIVNRTSSTLIVGRDYDDTIKNLAANVTISVGSGSDSVYNTGTYASILAGSGNDTIMSTGSYSTVYAGAGDDIATVNGYRSQATFEDGNDTVFTSTGNYITIIGDGGNDSITGKFSYSSINGGADDDLISISGGAKNTVDAGTGNDTIISAITSGVLYNFTGGNDLIRGWTNKDSMSVASAWERVTVGNDVWVSVEGVGVTTLEGAKGKTIYVYPRELSAEKIGFDIVNTKSATLITGNAYGDTIKNSGSRVTISVGSGSDSIYHTGSYGSILAGEDIDTIISTGSYSTVYAGDGGDKVTIGGSRVQVDLETGNDEFFGKNNLNYATVNAGDGSDTIIGKFYYSSINGGADDDLISISGGSKNTVDAGAGNDTIISAVTSGVLYNFTGGNDLIKGWNNRDSMSVASSWERVTVGNDILVSVEGVGVTTLEGAKGKTVNVYPKDLCVEIDTSGLYVNNSTAETLIVGKPYDDTIRNTGARVTISVGAGADSIYNNGAQASITAGDGKDTIYNYNSGDNSFIDSGAGDDTIFSPDGDNVTISGNSGGDTITGKFWTSSISGGADNDLISIGGGSKNTVNAGTGNDTIISSIKKGFLFEYEGGDDYVSGWTANDSISLPSSVTYAQSTVGNDVRINFSSGDVVTLAGASGKAINIVQEKTITPTITAQQFIKDFMKSLDTTDKSGVAALNEAISVASGGYYSDMQTARNKMVADCQSVGNATTFLVDKCGIDLYNTDTGAITGYDAGGSTSPKTASSVIPESGSLDTSFTNNYFVANGLNFYLTDMNSNYTLTWKNYSDLTTDAERFVWRALKTWWGKGALDLNAESYGDNFGFDTTSSATTKNMYVAFVNESNSTLATTWNWSSNGTVTQLAMTVNMNYYNSIDTTDPNGSSSTAGATYLDRTLTHEFTHAVMAANINYFNDLPQFIKEGMAELTHGIDDARGYNILNLAGNSSSLYNALDVTNVQTGTVEAYAGGFMFLRYIAKQVAENYSANSNASKPSGSQNIFSVITSEIEIDGETLTANSDFSGKTIDLAQYSPNIRTVDASALSNGVNITGNTYANKILGGTAADTISGNTGNDTILGGSGGDIIFGDAGDDSINGGADADTIFGGSGDNTLTGGDGADIFVHTAGNDFITDYTAREDKIQLVDGAIIGSSISGADVVLKFMTSSVTVKGGADKDITVIDSEGNETTQKYFNSTTDALWFDGGNNFITEDAQIDSITELSETNYSIENIFAAQNYSALTSNETLVTAADYSNQK